MVFQSNSSKYSKEQSELFKQSQRLQRYDAAEVLWLWLKVYDVLPSKPLYNLY